MIKEISIKNVAIAENLSITFDVGLNIITGETGAGKSLLIDALTLLRGTKVDTSIIRTGSDTAQVCAIFTAPNNTHVCDLLKDNGLFDSNNDSDIFIRKLIQRNGKHRSFINDTPVSSKTLQLITEELIDINSQFENQRLLNPSTHTFYLDIFAECDNLSKSVATQFELISSLIKNLTDLETKRDIQKREKSLFEFELNEINEAELNETEFVSIEKTLAISKKTEIAQSLCNETIDLLDNNEQSCSLLLKHIKKNIEKLEKTLSSTNIALPIFELNDAIGTIDLLSNKMNKILNELTIDENDLSFAQQKIEIYNKLLRKFGPTLEQVFKHKNACELFLSSISSLDNEIDALKIKFAAEITSLIKNAKTLSTTRQKSAQKLCHLVENELAELGMKKSKFICSLVPNAPKTNKFSNTINDIIEKNNGSTFLQLNRYGFEEARFLLGANVGIEPLPIEKVASGGELSRVMLAIKTILYANDSVSLFVFDEIDSGISGNIAAKVGKKLAQFCNNLQAICITHLPQVACYATTHFVAKKTTINNIICAQIIPLSPRERVTELATLLSGEKITKESLAHGQALIDEAKSFLNTQTHGIKAPVND